MRIAYLCADFGVPIRGGKGASVHVREVVAALTAQGHDVRVLSPAPGAGNPLACRLDEIAPAGLPAATSQVVGALADERWPSLATETRELAYNVTLYRHARALFRSWRPDAIYERYSLFNRSGLALARRLGIPHLLEVNAPLRLERARTKGLALEAMARHVERRLFRGSNVVLTVSTPLWRYVLDHGGHPARALVLPNAVDTQRFHPRIDGAATRARWHVPPGALVIGFAGSLKPWHGVETLLDAFALLRPQVSEARLLVVGTGPREAALRERAAMLGLQDTVLFTGGVPHEAMPGLLAAMDIAAAPYSSVPDFYFSPLKLYEYMAAGLAVVASATGEIGSLVREGHTGVLCPPDDPAVLARTLLQLARDPQARARLGQAARAEAERHTWEANARAIATLAAPRGARWAGTWASSDPTGECP
jgi:glycosyltransferase involved in cell wall biosynthesis